MKLSLIVAMADNRAIGLNNRMPWHLSADLQKFRQITWGSPIIMGRKTFEAIGRPLPGRANLIVSRNGAFRADGCETFASPEAALNRCADCEQAFVIGGATLYEALLPRADCLYLTQIHRTFPGDTFFPVFVADDWQETAREDVTNDPSVDFAYSFITLQRKRN